MGLKKKMTNKYGYESEYLKIIGYRVEPLYNRADVMLGVYKDKDAADSGAEPVDVINKRIFDRPQPKGSRIKELTAYTDYLSVQAMDGRFKGENILQILYTAVKEIPRLNDTEIDLSDAEDV